MPCLSYGHIQKHYDPDLRCKRCGEDHLSDFYTKSSGSTVKCALWNNSYTVNYKGCLDYKKLKRVNPSNRRDPSILITFSSKNNPPKASFDNTEPSYAQIPSSGKKIVNFPQIWKYYY